ncbi:hypothetical protein B0H13DRAFT_1895896 [Mycena leptocephala]|nr:hypothetical protein B0H13DRAFT_1895896 [Mycena leptocephala]
MLRHHTKLFFHRHVVDYPPTTRTFAFPSLRRSEMRAYVLYLCVLVLSRTSDLPPTHTNSKDLRRWRLELADQAERARLVSIQTKCEQWKAVSARYYGNHPEVKERKRVIMAEKRAAKKLAKRRWDPPKPPKPTPDVELNAAPRCRTIFRERGMGPQEAAAAASLLFLQQSTQRIHSLQTCRTRLSGRRRRRCVLGKEGKSDGSDNN